MLRVLTAREAGTFVEIGPPRLAAAIGAAMFSADLVGRLHAVEAALGDERFAQPEEPTSWTNPRVVLRAIRFLEDRGLMTPEQFEALRAQYGSAALKIAGVANKGMLGLARDAIADSARRGLSVAAGADNLLANLEAAGYSALEPWHARLVVHMAYAEAYGRASWDVLHDPRLRGLIPFFRYVTREDERVRETHAAMDNFFAPRSSPVWRVWWPPAGFNCRCRVVGVNVQTVRTYGIVAEPWPRDPNDSRRRVMPDEGFRSNPASRIRSQASTLTNQAVTRARRGLGGTGGGSLGPAPIGPPPRR